MAVTVLERALSRKLTASATNPAIELAVIAWGSEDEAEVLEAVKAFLPLVYFNLALIVDSVGLDPQGGGVWYGAAAYGLPNYGTTAAGEPFDGLGDEAQPPAETPQPVDPSEPLGSEFSMEVGAQTVHVTQSLETVDAFVNAALAAQGVQPPDYKGAIGVTKDGVEGTDVTAGQLSWSVTNRFAFVTQKYIDTLTALVGTVNDAHWRGRPARTVRFDGATVQIAANKQATVTHKFTNAYTVFDLEVGTISIPEKAGWDYLWFTYAPGVSNGFLVETPQTAHVERVLTESDFVQLGLGA